MKRTPVYLVVDTSSSMSGEDLTEVREAIKTLLNQLKCDPLALETVYVSVVTFNDSAAQIVPLTEVSLFSLPEMDRGGTTDFNKALEAMSIFTEFDGVGGSEDLMPTAFVFSNGAFRQPTNSQLAALKKMKFNNIYAYAVGKDSGFEGLKRINPDLLRHPVPGSTFASCLREIDW